MKNKVMNKSAVRRAISTLKNAGVVKSAGWNGDDFPNNKVTIVINVDAELTFNKPKLRRIYNKQKLYDTQD